MTQQALNLANAQLENSYWRCVKCDDGSPEVEMKAFKKDYIPPFAYVGLVLGPLIGLLIILGRRVQHDLTLPFCKKCWRNLKRADLFETLSVFSFFVSIVLGVALLLNLDSWTAFFIFPVLAGALIVGSQIYKRENYPKFKTVHRKQVVVTSAASKDIVFAK